VIVCHQQLVETGELTADATAVPSSFTPAFSRTVTVLARAAPQSLNTICFAKNINNLSNVVLMVRARFQLYKLTENTLINIKLQLMV
jgi:hypothetical protein